MSSLATWMQEGIQDIDSKWQGKSRVTQIGIELGLSKVIKGIRS